MQKVHTTRNLQKVGAGPIRRAPRSKSVCKSKKNEEDITPVIANGLYSLKPKTKLVYDISGVMKQIVPAYYRFCELYSMLPVKLNVPNPVKSLVAHMNKVLGSDAYILIMNDDEEDKVHLLYRTVLLNMGNWFTVPYVPVLKAIGRNKRMKEVFHAAIFMLCEMGVNTWNSYEDLVIDWLEDGYYGYPEENEVNDNELKYYTNLKNLYSSGKANIALGEIKTERSVEELDKMLKKLRKTPVDNFFRKVHQLYKQKKHLQDFETSYPDDGSEPYWLFSESFYIVYDYDEVFDQWDEYVCTNGNEGVSCPVIETVITPETEKVDIHLRDQFPEEMIELFDNYNDLSTQLIKWKKSR